MSEKKFVIFQGARMVEWWPERIIEAQDQVYYDISGEDFRRIPYGNEADDWGADRGPCHDCRVIKGQLHVVGCDVERCPKCDGQAITCDCGDEGIEEDSQ